MIVYTSDKSGENDIYFQRVDGSTEMHLSIPEDQRDAAQAQSGKKLTAQQVKQLVDSAAQIKSELGCQ